MQFVDVLVSAGFDWHNGLMDAPLWVNVLEAAGTTATPVVVAGVAFVLGRSQSRSGALLGARLESYTRLAPQLNRLMCYMTFIGTWREQAPTDVIALKRTLDSQFYCAAPLFSPDVLASYELLMGLTFVIFGDWGVDARIRSSAYRRRQCWQGTGDHSWQPGWNEYFTVSDSTPITAGELREYRQQYDRLLAAMVKDLDLTRARARYTTDVVSLNAHSPVVSDVAGSSVPLH